MREKKPIVLIFVSYYLPGFKAGGILRTLANTVDTLSDSFHFKIVCLDRDLGDREPYPGVQTDKWIQQGDSQVYYCNPHTLSMAKIQRILANTEHEVLHLNSIFDPNFTIRTLWKLRFSNFYSNPVILAPRGELDPSGLSIKRTKKRVFLALAWLLGLYKRVFWHASTALETDYISNVLNISKAKIWVAQDLPTPIAVEMEENGIPTDEIDTLRMVYLSRIAVEKNLDYALKVLARVTAKVTYHIYGPIIHQDYWDSCLKMIAKMPNNIEVKYMGAANPQEVAKIFAQYHLFFLPTTGESYGHVIAESLSAGTPALISDKTPWQGFEENGIGANFALDRPDCFVNFIQNAATLTNRQTLFASRTQIKAIYKTHYKSADITAANIALFKNVVDIYREK